MWDMAELRKQLSTIVAEDFPGVNVYGWPEPQPEYPCVLFPVIDVLAFHQENTREGVLFDWSVEVWVANADIEQATRQLESLIDFTASASLIATLERKPEPGAPWVNLVVHEARDFRNLEALDGLGCDLALTVHV